MTGTRFQTPNRHGKAPLATAMLFLGVLASGDWNLLSAQCPDGTPPPCGPQRVVPLDASRIAVFPFRVAAADTLLGEGLAELLVLELEGQAGARPVHMGSVLRVWRAAGGGPRAPLGQHHAVAAARALGAGTLIDGSVVGSRDRLTVSARVVSVADGGSRRVPAITGPADSLAELMARFGNATRAVWSGEARAAAVPLSGSPRAVSLYIDGMRAYRRLHIDEAYAAFSRALAEDTTFARAAFMLLLAAGWSPTFLFTEEQWKARVWALRQHLGPDDRVIITALLGERFPEQRSAARIVADLERAALLLPESPEAHYLAADYLLHWGRYANIADNVQRSLTHFRRSLALDSQETVLQHAVDAALLASDTAALRGLRAALDGSELWTRQWLAAVRSGDAAWLAALRSRPSPAADTLMWNVRSGQSDYWMLEPALIEEAIALRSRLTRFNPQSADNARYLAATIQGRPAVAAGIIATAPTTRPWDRYRLTAALFGDGDTLQAVAAVRRLVAANADTLPVDLACLVALWRLSRGESDGRFSDVADSQRGRTCALVVAVARTIRSGGDLRVRLAAADSAVRSDFSVRPGEHLVLARGWELAGEPRRALEAARLRVFGFGAMYHMTDAVSLREEGRLATILGDTAAAIAAYRSYLDLRRFAEPALIPRRDSVAAALAALERGRR